MSPYERLQKEALQCLREAVDRQTPRKPVEAAMLEIKANGLLGTTVTIVERFYPRTKSKQLKRTPRRWFMVLRDGAWEIHRLKDYV